MSLSVSLRGGSDSYVDGYANVAIAPVPASVAIGLPSAGVMDNVYYSAYATIPESGGNTSGTAVYRISNLGDALSLDLSSMQSPITNANVSYDSATQVASVGWVTQASGVVGSVVQLVWSPDPTIDPLGTMWTIVAPAGTFATTPPLTADLVTAEGTTVLPPAPQAGQVSLSRIFLVADDTDTTASMFRGDYGTWTVLPAEANVVPTTPGQAEVMSFSPAEPVQ